MISCIYGLVDVAVVGQYQGTQGTAALSIVAPIWTILYSLGILTGSGGSVKYTYYKAQGKNDKANAYFTSVMGTVPKILLVADNGLFRQSVKEEMVVLLHHTKYDRAAVGVGESRVAFPETAGKSTACRFELHFRSLATAYQGTKSALYICCMFCHGEYRF